MIRRRYQFDGVIFDVDGTLWDATEVAAAAWNTVFEQEKLTLRVTAEQLKHLFGKPMDTIFAELFPELPAGRRNAIGSACMKLENENLQKTPGRCYPGIRETCAELSGRCPLFIVSNCQTGYIELAMQAADIEPFITGHLCFGETGVSKGQTIRILMERYGLKSPVYVGDVQGDADACSEAGIPIIHAAYGYGTIREPLAVILTPAELTEII